MKTVKLNPKQLGILWKALQRGIVPGGIDATFAQAYKLMNLGLLQNSKVRGHIQVPSDAGIEVLRASDPVRVESLLRDSKVRAKLFGEFKDPWS